MAVIIWIFILTVAETVLSVPQRISGVTVTNLSSLCSSHINLESAKNLLTNEIVEALQDETWVEVYSLDMTKYPRFCPYPWTETAGLCVSSSCSVSATFPVPKRPYSKVRGRVTGYGVGGLDGFNNVGTTIETGYVDGVSITYGSSPRKHIWSFAAGFSWQGHNRHCPCDATVAPRFPPAFVGNNYYCDRAYNGFLWDGEGCHNSSCCTFNKPPWFTVTLPSPTNDSIEVRMCTNEHISDERIHIQKIQLYVA